MTLGIVLDLIVLAIIALTILISAKHGFVRTLIEVVGFIAAFVIAFNVSTPLANATYDKFIEPPLISSFQDAAVDGVGNSTEAVWEAMPDFITNNADSLGLKKEDIKQNLTDSASNNASEIVINLSQNVLKPTASKIISMVYTTVLLIVLLFVVKILAKLVNKLFSISIVGKLNRTLGGVVGLVKGVVFAVVLCMVISTIISFTENGFLIFTRDAIESSVLFKTLANVFSII